MLWLVRPVGLTATLIFIGASMAMNFVFASGLGRTEKEGLIFGCVSIAADAFKAILPVAAFAYWKERQRFRAGAAVFVFIIFAGWGFLSALGYTAENRGFRSGSREALAAELGVVESETLRLSRERTALGSPRPQAVIESELRALRLERLWERTANCRDIRTGDGRTLCQRYEALQREMALAVELARIGTRLETLRREAAALRAAGAHLEKDAQAGVLARITGFRERAVLSALVIGTAVLIELGSSLGLFLAGFKISPLPRPAAPQPLVAVERVVPRRRVERRALPPAAPTEQE